MTAHHATAFCGPSNLRLSIKRAIESNCKKNPTQCGVFLAKLILFHGTNRARDAKMRGQSFTSYLMNPNQHNLLVKSAESILFRASDFK